jgi:hypothetical protein
LQTGLKARSFTSIGLHALDSTCRPEFVCVTTNISAPGFWILLYPKLAPRAVFFAASRLGSDAGRRLRRVDNHNSQPRLGSSDETLRSCVSKREKKLVIASHPSHSRYERQRSLHPSQSILSCLREFLLDHEQKATSRVNPQCCTFYPHLPPREVQSKVLVPQLLVSSADFKLISAIKVL